MCVASVVAGLVGLGWVRTDEAVRDLRLVAAVDEVSPDANALLVVIGEAWGALVLGGLAVPAAIKDAAVCGVREQAVEARAVRR